MTDPAQLLADCRSRGVRLLAEDDGGLSVDAPDGALQAAFDWEATGPDDGS